ILRPFYTLPPKPIAGEPAQAQLDAALRYATEYHIKLQSATRGVSRMRQQFSAALYVLMGAVGLLLLAVCASVSGMLLAKAEQRKREIAIRVAVGARPAQLLRQTFAESLLWTIPSALLALFFFYVMSPVLIGMLPEVRGFTPTYATPQAIDVSLDYRVILFVVAVCLLTIFLSGLGAAWRSAKVNVVEDLKQHQQSKSGAFSGITMVGIQVSISVVLVAGAVLMLKTFWTLQHLNPGFDRAHIVEFDLNPETAGYSTARAKTFVRELRQEIALLPGVRSVAGAWAGVMHGIGLGTTVVPEGEVLPKKTFLNTSANNVTTGYFRTLGIPLLAGRTLEETDRDRKPQPLVVNEAFAKKFFPHQNPIGKAIVYGTDGNKAPNGIIVGVVGTAKYRSLRENNPPIAYSLSFGRVLPVLYARTFGNPEPLLGEIRKLIHARDSSVPIIASATLEQEVKSTLWQERLLTLLSGFFAIVALTLAAAGIYGALAYSVATRTREIGIRMAIGAQPRDIVRTVSARMFAAIVAGLLLGTVAAAILLQISRKLFFGVQGFDAPAFLITIGCIFLCGALAAMIPAYRAIKTDPVSAMRLE
ncbi:MAG: FtsX-like permease family protein, partial [Bryobacteraceae bacterium]